MRGRLGAGAEVARGADQSRAKVMQPNAIHQYPGGQRVVFAGDGFGQAKASAALGKRLPTFAGQDFQKLSGYFLALVDGISALENARVLLDRAVFEDDRVRR